MADYLYERYGWMANFICGKDTRSRLPSLVVRIVGGYSEGSGFFVADNLVVTNFHVIDYEPSPKVIFPDGSFTTPYKIVGNKKEDLALLYLKEDHPEMVFDLPESVSLHSTETLIASGYPLGTVLSGSATVVKGTYINMRKTKDYDATFIQSDINLVEGMSGGPLTDDCGELVGVNTRGLSGLSLFINAAEVRKMIPDFTDQNITKIKADPAASPEAAVEAFYIYLKSRRMEDGFNLLSKTYLQKTNYEEWTNRFNDILDVDVVMTEKYNNSVDTVWVKFSTKNWNDSEVDYHHYEGTWQTVKEDGVYKMLRSNIKEVSDPELNWFY